VTDIVERLSAAIAEKEVLALATSSLNWKTHDTHCGGPGGHCAVVMSAGGEPRPLVAWLPTFKHPGWDVPAPWANATFIADNDPASVLRDCAADREIVKLYVDTKRLSDDLMARVLRGDVLTDNENRLARDADRELTAYGAVLNLVARGYGLEDGQ